MPPVLAALELRTDQPQVGKERLDRCQQVVSTCRTAGTHFAADGPLYHFRVTITPFLKTLVHIDQVLADVAHRGILAIDLYQQRLQLR